MEKKYVVYALIFLAGVALSNKVRALPGGKMIPTV